MRHSLKKMILAANILLICIIILFVLLIISIIKNSISSPSTGATHESAVSTVSDVSDTSAVTPAPDNNSQDRQTQYVAANELTSLHTEIPVRSSEEVTSPSADTFPSAVTSSAVSSPEEAFSISPITDDVYSRIVNVSYPSDCDIPLSELRYIKVLHYGFDDNSHQGELIVHTSVAEDILDIFKELYEQHYPIERITLIDAYGADDEDSMRDNNTSSFNYRTVAGSTVLSKHAFGMAIDINPLYNPYVYGDIIQPSSAEKYADRSSGCKYYISKDDICYKAFTSRGFVWGGDWKTKKDYQHFEKALDIKSE